MQGLQLPNILLQAQHWYILWRTAYAFCVGHMPFVCTCLTSDGYQTTFDPYNFHCIQHCKLVHRCCQGKSSTILMLSFNHLIWLSTLRLCISTSFINPSIIPSTETWSIRIHMSYPYPRLSSLQSIMWNLTPAWYIVPPLIQIASPLVIPRCL